MKTIEIYRNEFRNFDQNWSKFRSISIVFEILTKFRRNWGKNFEKTIEIGQKLIEIWSKLGWKFRKRSKLGRNFRNWSKLIEISINFDEISKMIDIYRNFDQFRSISKNFDRFEMKSKFLLRNEISKNFVSKNETETKWTILINFATSWWDPRSSLSKAFTNWAA